MENLLLKAIIELRETLEKNNGDYGVGVEGSDLEYVNDLANRFLSVTRHTQGQQVIPCILIRIPVEGRGSRSRTKVCAYRGSLSPREMRAFMKNTRLERDNMFKEAYGVDYTFENLRKVGHNIGAAQSAPIEAV